MMEAVLSNADHPEYGVATIPIPIPRNQYDHCVALLEALEIGDASEADCRLDSIDSAWSVLNRLVYIKCPYCQHNSIVVYEDTRGHVETKCKKCGKITVFDVLSMRKIVFCLR